MCLNIEVGWRWMFKNLLLTWSFWCFPPLFLPSTHTHTYSHIMFHSWPCHSKAWTWHRKTVNQQPARDVWCTSSHLRHNGDQICKNVFYWCKLLAWLSHQSAWGSSFSGCSGSIPSRTDFSPQKTILNALLSETETAIRVKDMPVGASRLWVSSAEKSPLKGGIVLSHEANGIVLSSPASYKDAECPLVCSELGMTPHAALLSKPRMT